MGEEDNCLELRAPEAGRASEAHRKRGVIRATAAYTGMFALFAMLGAGLGWALHELRVKGRSQRVQEYLNTNLEESLRGFEVGLPLPEIPIWSEDLNSGTTLREVVTGPALVIYLSASCAACSTVVSLISQSISGLKDPTGKIILITFGPTDSLRRHVERHGLSLRIFRDVEEAFPRQYGVVSQPTYFLVDPDGNLEEFGTGDRLTTELSRLFQVLDSRSAVQSDVAKGRR